MNSFSATSLPPSRRSKPEVSGFAMGCRVGTAHRSPLAVFKIPHPPVTIHGTEFTVRHYPVGRACLLTGWRRRFPPSLAPCAWRTSNGWADRASVGRGYSGEVGRRPKPRPRPGRRGGGCMRVPGSHGERTCLALPTSHAAGARQPVHISRSRSVALSWMSCQALCTCTASV